MTRATKRGLALAGVAIIWSIAVGSAASAASAPAWSIHSVSMPTYVSPTSGGHVVVLATNIGGAATETENENGEPLPPVAVTDVLPPGLTATAVTGEEKPHNEAMECPPPTGATVTCTYAPSLPSDGTDGLVLDISVAASASGPLGENEASVTGGGAAEATTSNPVTVGASLPLFGLGDFRFGISGTDGAADTQAGAHPNALTVGFDLNTMSSLAGNVLPVQPPRSIAVELPLGLVGNPQAAAKCPQYDLAQNQSGVHCPSASIIGTVAYSGEAPGYTLSEPGESRPEVSPLFNVVPEHGYPAEFAFVYASHAAFMYASVAHTSSGYVLRTTVPAIPPLATINGAQLIFFGNPAVKDGGQTLSRPFFTNPTGCTSTPLTAKIEASSWADPAGTGSVNGEAGLPATTGCDLLQFEPKIAVRPETTQVDTPTGLTFDLKIPQNEEANGRATPTLKDATVTLPDGMSVSPSSASGLGGCPATGSNGINLYGEELGADEQEHLVPGHCPASSTIGTVKVATPLLETPLEGSVYLAQPECEPCSEADAEEGRMVKLYIEAAGSGVNIKLPGTVEIGGNGGHSAATGLQPGQLRTSFLENPQLPFSELELTLKNGPYAPLANPQGCGPASTTSDLVPWSAPQTSSATPTSFFSVDWDGAGAACPTTSPFAPSFLAGMAGTAAGAFSPFTLTMTRHDGEQDLAGVTVHLPPGLLGQISSVQECPEPQASIGACSPESLIGHTQVAAGPGPHPFWVAGNVYLTRPYRGAPFGLSIVTRAKAGPFDLGNVVVRAAIFVDPHTAALTIVSDPLPQIVDGVPLRIQTINATVDRPGVTFNPTDCAQQTITATIAAAQGATATVATPFAAAACKNLPFKPSFLVSTQARTSKASGASLHVRVTSGTGQANIAKVRVALPKQLPSRLTTLQKACTETVFDANPASCPAGSLVGTATAVTPILKSPLSGPAYLVSHGGAAFPDLVIVLQGEGVTLYLDGNTDIKKGITISTFNSVPDAPVSTFDLDLPEGPHSALTANQDLCRPTRTVRERRTVARRVHGRERRKTITKERQLGQSLTMPTAITGQNGAVIAQSTKIAVIGCPKRAASGPKHRHTKNQTGKHASTKVKKRS